MVDSIMLFLSSPSKSNFGTYKIEYAGLIGYRIRDKMLFSPLLMLINSFRLHKYYLRKVDVLPNVFRVFVFLSNN